MTKGCGFIRANCNKTVHKINYRDVTSIENEFIKSWGIKRDTQL